MEHWDREAVLKGVREGMQNYSNFHAKIQDARNDASIVLFLKNVSEIEEQLSKPTVGSFVQTSLFMKAEINLLLNVSLEYINRTLEPGVLGKLCPPTKFSLCNAQPQPEEKKLSIFITLI